MTHRGKGQATPPSASELEGRAKEAAAGLRDEFLGALIAVTVDGRIISWNSGASSQFGYSAAEAIGQSLFDLTVPPEAAAGTRQWLRATLSDGSATFEATRRRRDGSTVFVDVSARAVRQEGAESLIVLNERDVSALKRQREAQVLQTRFRGVLDAAPDAIVLVDETGVIALVNSETERLFGYARHELIGQLIEVLVPERFRATHPSRRTAYIADPRTRPMGSGLQLAGRRKDGSEFPVEISLSPLSVDEATFAMAAIRDVTIQKERKRNSAVCSKRRLMRWSSWIAMAA